MLSVSAVATLDVSAASGLVALPDRLCLVADDETFLAVYALDGTPMPRIPLFADALPNDHAERKRRKPDLEAVALLNDGRILALGSGSAAARRRGALLDPTRDTVARAINIGPLYDRLAREVPELNIEGAAVSGDALWLLQRGNGSSRFNACIELGLSEIVAALDATESIDADVVRSVTHVDLGELDGVPLSFTDAIAAPGGGLIFSAAAEDTNDTYQDGPCAGSVIGVLADGRVMQFVRVDPSLKLEGIALTGDRGSRPTLWLVADPDDREKRASLYRAELPFG